MSEDAPSKSVALAAISMALFCLGLREVIAACHWVKARLSSAKKIA